MTPREIIRLVHGQKLLPMEHHELGETIRAIINPSDSELRYEITGTVVERGGGWIGLRDAKGAVHIVSAHDLRTRLEGTNT